MGWRVRLAATVSVLPALGAAACLDASGPPPNFVSGAPDLTGVVTQVTYQEICIPVEVGPGCANEFLVWLTMPPDTAPGAVLEAFPGTPVFVADTTGSASPTSVTSILIGDSLAVWWTGVVNHGQTMSRFGVPDYSARQLVILP